MFPIYKNLPLTPKPLNLPLGTDKCKIHQWKCDDGTCIDQILRCNSKADCPDNSDETGCNQCTSDQFRCNNGSCVSLAARCNGQSECEHGEDEKHCG